MKKNVLIINGHPDSKSLCTELAESYARGVKNTDAQYKIIHLGNLDFDPILHYGYRQRTELEDCLLEAQQDILWANHLVFVYPVWWGTYPALLKGFIDRVFIPGFAFKYRENSLLWDKFLKGKSARLIVTMDSPSWYNRLVYRNASQVILKKAILGFCGVAPVRSSVCAPVKTSTPAQRQRWMENAERLGNQVL